MLRSKGELGWRNSSLKPVLLRSRIMILLLMICLRILICLPRRKGKMWRMTLLGGLWVLRRLLKESWPNQLLETATLLNSKLQRLKIFLWKIQIAVKRKHLRPRSNNLWLELKNCHQQKTLPLKLMVGNLKFKLMAKRPKIKLWGQSLNFRKIQRNKKTKRILLGANPKMVNPNKKRRSLKCLTLKNFQSR